jgi:hypothetical protein
VLAKEPGGEGKQAPEKGNDEAGAEVVRADQ